MKEITIKCKDQSYVREITIKGLPNTSEGVIALSKILDQAKNTDGFQEIINEMRGCESFYSRLAKYMILTKKLSEELYELIYDVFKGFTTVEDTLLLTIYTANPVPKHIYDEICKRRN